MANLQSAALSSENPLMEDTKLLDWLEKYVGGEYGEVIRITEILDKGFCLESLLSGKETPTFPTLREAIRAAMQQQEQPTNSDA